MLQPFGPVTSLRWLPSALVSWFGMFLVWTVLYSLIQSLRRASRFEAEALRLQVLAKDAELRALQAQVNPHFFFNSLNSVRALVFENQEAAADMVDQLAGADALHAAIEPARDRAARRRMAGGANLSGDRNDPLRRAAARDPGAR